MNRLDKFSALMYYSWQKPSRLIHYLKTGYVTGVEVLINHDLKSIYVLNPKVATTSIVEMLSTKPHQGGRIFHSHRKQQQAKGISYLDVKQIKDLQKRGYFVFTFVRNPYSRAVSFFKQKYTYIEGFGFKKRAFALSRGLEHVHSFDDMIEKMVNIPDSHADTHFMSQTAILYGQFEGLEYDFIGKLEDFNTGFDFVKKELKIKSEIVSKNTTENKDWARLYSKKTLNLVLERYRSDFSTFGYLRLENL
ncbi:MAG: sulfotransferase family 2 domain-containing protein [Methyloprofundus sp.]|nr:sulfotransferase family 2 domain-containing protein [Methyloprofundus sp.]